MANDEDQRPQTRKYFRPKGVKSGMKGLLTMGISTPSLDDTNHGLSIAEEWRTLQNGLKPDQMLCPNCHTRLELTEVFEDENDPHDTTSLKLVSGPVDQSKVIRALGCDCGYTLPVEDLFADVRAELRSIKSAETQYYVYGLLTILGFGTISFFNGSGITLLGGLVLGLFLVVRGFLFRFRHWQIGDPETRMFQDKTQFWTWLKHELTN